MSAASPTARPAPGMPKAKRKTLELLGHMKLRAPNDPFVHQKLSRWINLQQAPTHIHPTKVMACRISSSLLLQRFVRAFENRLGSSSDNKKGSTVQGDRSNPFLPTNGNTAAREGSPKLTNFIRGPSKLPKKLPALCVLMQRKVKVTQLVKQAVQFVGSDVLKVLQVANPSPTVTDVANFCLSILNNESRIKEFYRIFSESSGKEASPRDESSAIFFGVFALQALQSLRAQAISAYEFSHDFEMIYRACYQDENFRMCMHELNPAMNPFEGMPSASFAPDTEARNICWKMARLLALKYDCKNKSNPDVKDHRRNHILLSATSIILAANIGKSVKNGEVSTRVTQDKARIPDEEDFSALAVAPVSDLLAFLAKNTSQNQGITPIRTSDILSHAMEACKLITQVGMGQQATGNIDSINFKSLLAKAFSLDNHRALMRDYRNIIKTLVTETQKELKINITNHGKEDGAKVRTGIVDVLLFFPMVIGEPWGIHRDAPMITSKMLCWGENSKPSHPLKDSVAVVMKMHPRTIVPKRKADSSVPNATDAIRIPRKKAKPISLLESPKKISPGENNFGAEVSTSPASKTPINQRRGNVETPFINDAAEMNEWTLSILSLSVIKPTDSLLTYIGENDRMRGDGSSCLQDVIVPVLNRGALRIQNAIRSASNVNSEAMETKLSVGRRDGQVYVNGVVDNIVQLCASIVGFYYYSLEAIIQDEMDRMDFLGSFGSQLQSRPFHRALLACCYSCVLKGVGMYPKLLLNKMCEDVTIQALMDCTESDPFTLLKVTEAFCRALIAIKEVTQQQNGFPVVSGLPLTINKHAQKVEAQLIDSLLWSKPSASELSAETCFAHSIKTMNSLPGAWPPDILEPILPEELTNLESESSKSTDVRYKPSFGSSSEANFVSFVLRKLLKIVFFRIRAICAALDLSNEGALQTQILVAFRYILRHHISLFIDRHVDQLLLCSIYGVCRVMQIEPKITFGKVIDAYLTVREEDQGETACRMVVRHIKLTSEGNESRPNSQVVGNIVVFYNTVYIPKMQKYFLESKSLKGSAESYKNASEKKNHGNGGSDMPSNDSAGAVITRTSQSSDSQSGPATAQSGDRDISLNSPRKNSSLRKYFSDRVDLTKKAASPNSLKEVPKPSGTSPMEVESDGDEEIDPITSPSVGGNPRRLPLRGEKAAYVRENPTAAAVSNNSEQKSSDKTKPLNGTKPSDSSIELDAKVLEDTVMSEADDKKEGENAVPNVAVHAEENEVDGSGKKWETTITTAAATNGTAAIT